jgi:sigma-E factor negative regulatory protein RseA
MKQQLSAFMDGEISLEEAPHLITAVKAGGAVKQAWADYHLIGDAMRGDQALSTDLTARIMVALEAEPTILLPNPQHAGNHQSTQAHQDAKQNLVLGNQRFYTSHKLWSIAASVAAVLFVGVITLQQYMQEETLAPVQIAQELPEEYLAAHQSAAPSNAAYYIQQASYTEHN